MSRTKSRKPGHARRKREAEENERSVKKQAQEKRAEDAEYDPVIANETPEELTTRFTNAIQKHKGDLSTIELEDQSIPSKAVRDTSGFSELRTTQTFPQYLKQFVNEKELKVCAGEASPHTLIVTAAAIRATDLIRAVREFGSEESKIAKLFTKHMKLKENINYVQKTRFGIGVGTPARIEAIHANEALKLDELKRIVVDASYVNTKKNTIFDDPDGFPQLLSLLNIEKLKLRLVSGQTELLFF